MGLQQAQVHAQSNVCWQLLGYKRDGKSTLSPQIKAFGTRLESREQGSPGYIQPLQAVGRRLWSCESGAEGQHGAGGGCEGAQLSIKGRH